MVRKILTIRGQHHAIADIDKDPRKKTKKLEASRRSLLRRC
jgi:hypothetical protein